MAILIAMPLSVMVTLAMRGLYENKNVDDGRRGCLHNGVVDRRQWPWP